MNRTLENKVAIVTGAGGETGSMIARLLAEAGARVIVNDINPDRAERAAAQIREQGYEALAITADIANRFQCVNLIESTREQWGRIDILVNNAQVRPGAPILKMDEWAWQRCLDVNLKGAFFMCQLVGRVMADENQERGGAIVNVGVASDGDVLQIGFAAFAASKAGLAAFTAECAREFAPLGIRVRAVQSGTADEVLRLCCDS
jgi:NAD(P)-dependent dehydrogenase (short-subunit alcohol dehydrogenase family)